jgi:mitochondrial fission protein ELM1
MLDEGVDARSHILPISDSVFIMAYALELAGREDTTEYRKLKSAMLVLVNCSERKFVWHKADTITIDNAIDICVNNWTTVSSSILHEAMNHILGTIN